MLESLLDRAVATRGRVRVLRELFHFPAGFSASARSIAAAAGLDHRVAQRSLDELADLGFVEVRRTPAANYYQLNRDHILAEALASLFEAERGLREALRQELATAFNGRRLQVRAAYLFGSAARDEAKPHDIDIAVVFDQGKRSAVQAAIDEVQAELSAHFGLSIHVVAAFRPLDQMVRTEGDQGGLWHSVAAEGRAL